MVNNLCRVETQNEEIQPVVSYDPSSSVFMSSPDILNKLYLYSHLDTKDGDFEGGIPAIKSHDRWVLWQIKCITYPLAEDICAPHKATWCFNHNRLIPSRSHNLLIM